VPSRPKTVFLVVHQGFAARLLLRTDVLQTLKAAGARIVILAPNADEQYLHDEFAGARVHLETLREPAKVAKRSKLWWWVLHVRNYAIGDGHRTRALYQKYARFPERFLKGQPVEQRIFRLLVNLLWRSRLLRRGLLALELRLYTEDVHPDLFERYRPDLVVATSPGYFKPDARVLREAQVRGIPTAVVTLSWDNPTSKGYRGANPDTVIVWSQRMGEQMEVFQDFRAEQIVVGGVPHFDPYFRDGALGTREELFAELGLDPERRLLVFATSAPGYYDRDAEVAEVLARAIAEDTLGAPCQLVVRIHPNFPSKDVSIADFERVAERHPHVVLDVPTILSRRLSCDMPGADTRRLGALLRHCDVLVNVFSTTTLEAFAMDRPVVLIESKAVEYEHMREVLESGAAPVASTPEQIVSLVRRYLDDPSAEREQRRRIVAEEVGPADGRSGERIGRLLLERMGAASPPPLAGAGEHLSSRVA
jgi:hypothetical protein